jgi:hypothetical protein
MQYQTIPGCRLHMIDNLMENVTISSAFLPLTVSYRNRGSLGQVHALLLEHATEDVHDNILKNGSINQHQKAYQHSSCATSQKKNILLAQPLTQPSSQHKGTDLRLELAKLQRYRSQHGTWDTNCKNHN